MPDLPAFIRARLEEADAAVIGALAYDIEADWEDMPPRSLRVLPEYREYVDHFTPARAMWQIDAARATLARHVPEPGQHPGRCEHDKHELPCPTLRDLAAVWRDHPRYRPGWAP